MAKKISVINFKGGVGKTTLTLHLAAGISFFHKKRVLIVDVDHQSSLSVVILGRKWESTVDDGKIVNKIFEHFTEQGQPMPGEEIIIKRPYSSYPNLDLVSASLELDDIELELASTTRGDSVSSEFHKRTLLCSWIDENNLEEQYDYIFFDCPPATKLVSQNAIAASDYYIVPVIPDAISSRGLQHLFKLLQSKIDKKISSLANFLETSNKNIPNSYVRETKLGGVVISKIKTSGPAYSGFTNDHTQHLGVILERWGDEIIQPYIEEGVGVPEAMSQGKPVFDTPDLRNVADRNYIYKFKQLVNNTIGRIG